MTPARSLEVVGLGVAGLAPVELWLDEGECLGLSGPSGAGKSRLLRAIADLDVHDGRVACRGTSAEAMPATEWRRRVGMLAADSRWWRERVGEHFDPAPPERSLEALGLDARCLRATVAELSSGERQRLALLRLLANRPWVLLLDEPTANLDQDNIARVEALVAEYAREHGAAVLWVSHDPRQIRRVAHRHVHLRDGVLAAMPAPSASLDADAGE